MNVMGWLNSVQTSNFIALCGPNTLNYEHSDFLIFLHIRQVLVQCAKRGLSHEAETVPQIGDKSGIVVDKLYKVDSVQLFLDRDKAQVQVLAGQWV